jgi:prevent-host-death family protein
MARNAPHAKSYSIAEAKDNLSRLIAEASEGDEVTITRHGKPVATLKAVQPQRGTMSPEMMDRLAKLRAEFPPRPGSEDSVTTIRRMRDEEGD